MTVRDEHTDMSARYLNVREGLIEVVDNQLRDNEPPETRQTFGRLIAEGYSEDESKKLIACVLLLEMNVMMANNEVFNADRYVDGLGDLPDVPFDDYDDSVKE